MQYLPAVSFKTFNSCCVIDCFFVWISQHYTHTHPDDSRNYKQCLLSSRISRNYIL